KEDYVKTKGKYDEAAKPDYLDFDKDGNKKEPMKKALADKEKMQKEELKKEELKGNQHKIDKNKNNKIDAQDFAILRGQKKVKEDMYFAKKLIEGIKRSDVPASVRKARGDAPLTPAEVKSGSKDSISDSKNLAKARNEEVESLDEKNVPTSPEKWAKAKAAAKSKFAVYPSAYANGWASKKYKAMGGGWKSANEEVEQEEELIDEKAGYSAKAARAGKDIGKPGKAFSMIAKKAGERYGSSESGKRVAGAILAKLRKEDEDWSDEDIDALFEVYELEERKMSDSEMKKREDIVKGMKKGLSGFKARYGARAKDVMYATATKQAMKEGAEDSAAITTDTLVGRMPGGKSNDFKSYKLRVRPLDKEGEHQPKDSTPKAIQPDDTPARKSHETKQSLKLKEGKRPETDDAPPFEGPYTKIPSDVKDKSGAVHTPMSRARDLAKSAMKKLKTEMLGKIGTSESKK
ncbi:MAG: hypothetical protein EBU01_12530, partial [Crocinitomicaceae bacterium]|nr:hypothetical protein [Crocinitomicaceae bacterium]